MPISVSCPKCNATLKVKDDLAGKKGKCPKCQGTILVPAAAPAPAPRSASLAAAQPSSRPPLPTGEERARIVLAGLSSSAAPPAATLGFKVRLAITAVAVTLFSVLYAALVLALFGGAIWYFLNAGAWLAGTTGFGKGLLLYGPTILGVVLGILLLKPLVAPRALKGKRRPLSREKAPLLYEWLGKIADAVNAPPPPEILIDCNTNSEADNRKLVIGLPLAAGVQVENLAGIIARELARNARGTGEGLVAYIRRITGFFDRAVRGQDRWDEAVLAATKKSGISLGKLLYPLRWAFSLAKVLLWPLMYLARMLSGNLLQKTELEFDRAAIRLIGSKAFENTFRQLRVLDFAWQQVQADLWFQRTEHQLPDSLPRQVQCGIAQIPEDFRENLASAADISETPDFAIEPAERDRLAAAESAAAPAVYTCDLPATILFDDFDTLAKDVTWDYYLAELGPPLERRFLQPVITN